MAVTLYIQFPLVLRNVEDLLHERGIGGSCDTICFIWNGFGPVFAAEIRRKRFIPPLVHSPSSSLQ
jgi:Transposase and inactivated derivatives